MRKKCAGGHRSKLPISQFSEDKSRADGLSQYCKACRRKQGKRRRATKYTEGALKGKHDRFEFVQSGEPLKRRIYLGRAENGFDPLYQIVTAE